MRLSPDRYRRSVVGRITARITKCMDTVSRFIGAFLPWASPAKALGALPPRYPFWALQWPTQARIENAEWGKKLAIPHKHRRIKLMQTDGMGAELPARFLCHLLCSGSQFQIQWSPTHGPIPVDRFALRKSSKGPIFGLFFFLASVQLERGKPKCHCLVSYLSIAHFQHEEFNKKLNDSNI